MTARARPVRWCGAAFWWLYAVCLLVLALPAAILADLIFVALVRCSLVGCRQQYWRRALFTGCLGLWWIALRLPVRACNALSQTHGMLAYDGMVAAFEIQLTRNVLLSFMMVGKSAALLVMTAVAATANLTEWMATHPRMSITVFGLAVTFESI